MFKIILSLLLSHLGLELDALPEQLQDQLLDFARLGLTTGWHWLQPQFQTRRWAALLAKRARRPRRRSRRR